MPSTAFKEWKKYALVTLSLVETVLFSGLIFGWGTLVYILKQKNIYAELCHRNQTLGDVSLNQTVKSPTDNITSNGSCADQDNMLNLWFSLSIGITVIFSAIIGLVNQKIGPISSRIIFMFPLTIGAVIIAFTSRDYPWMIFPGLTFLGIGGFNHLISNARISFSLSFGSTIYVGLLNGLFDTSSGILYIVKVVFENGIDLKYSFITIAVLYLVISSFVTFLFKISRLYTVPDKEYVETQQEGNGRKHPKRYVCNSLYLLHLLWGAIPHLTFLFFIGSINWHLEAVLGENRKVSHFTDILSWMMLGGVVTSLLVGVSLELLRKYFKDSTSESEWILMPHVLPLAVCSVLAVIISVLGIRTVENSFYAIFVAAVVMRSLFYCILMDYILKVFPQEYYSILLGCVMSLNGIVSMLQYALFEWMNIYDGAVNHVNILLAVLGVISLVHPANIWYQARRRRDIQEYFISIAEV